MEGKKSLKKKKRGQYILKTEHNSKPGIFNDSNWKILFLLEIFTLEIYFLTYVPLALET